jgi:integrase
MPRRSKGPHLWLRPARRDRNGGFHDATWLIVDRSKQKATGCLADERDRAEQALAVYIAEKHSRVGHRDPTQIPITDVAVYVTDVVPSHARPIESRRRIARIAGYFGDKLLSDINGQVCRAYARAASTDAMARRDLEELRAAINHHRREGLHDRLVSVVLPPRRPARERWLTRAEAAQLLRAAWRRPKCRQLARFILFALYTGRRATVVCKASFRREPGRTWVDVDRGYLWPPERAKITKKRNPPAADRRSVIAAPSVLARSRATLRRRMVRRANNSD